MAAGGGPLARLGQGVSATGRFDRAKLLERLREDRVWDIIVVGGGATGLGCALDAAARGHSVVLLEAGDFAQGTSSRATKLIHGGLRYLAQGRLGLVRESLVERARLLVNAPHLVRPQRFVVPVSGRLERWRLGAGLWLYDRLAGRHGIGAPQALDAALLGELVPGLDASRFDGALSYWDAQFDDAGLALALMRTGLDLGALALNYVEVEAPRVDQGRVRGVHARDVETGESFRLQAHAVINATGVWSDALRRAARPDARPLLRASQGVHVVVSRALFPGDDALLVPHTPDGRVLFCVPWQDRLVIGTTDTARDDVPLEPLPLEGEIDLLCRTAAAYLVRPPESADFLSVFAGLRPLPVGRSGRTARLSRRHVLEVLMPGLVTMTGGKWTTYRYMAECAVDAAEATGSLATHRCVTGSLRIHDAVPPEVTALADAPFAAAPADDPWCPRPGFVRHAVRETQARTVEDVLARRSRVLFRDARLAAALAPAVARVMAEELGRDATWCEAEVAAFRALAAQYAGQHAGGGAQG